MTHEEIKQYFENTPPPKEVDWKPWAKIFDTHIFFKQLLYRHLQFQQSYRQMSGVVAQ